PTNQQSQGPSTSIPPSESSPKTIGPAGGSEGRPRPTGGPLVEIDGEMNPDHLHPKGESPSKETPMTRTSASQPDESGERKATSNPETLDMEKSRTPGLPVEPDDEGGLSPRPDLPENESTAGPISVTPRPNTSDRHPSTSVSSLESTSKSTEPNQTLEFTPVPDERVTQKLFASQRPESSSEPPIQFTGPADEKETTSRSPMEVQQSSTPELSPKSSTEASEPNKVDVTTSPAMSDKAGVSTPEPSLGTSTTFIGSRTGDDTTSRPTTNGQDRSTTELSSETEEPPVQFTGAVEASTGSDNGAGAASELTPTVQASTPKLSSVTSSSVTGPDNSANATTEPALKSVTSTPDMPDTKQTATSESSSEPPVQFTGAADEKEATSRSPMEVQQSSTLELSPGSSTEVIGPNKVGVTTTPAMSDEAGVSTPESSLGTSTIVIEPSTGDDTTSRPTPSDQDRSATESSSETEEPPVQFTGPADEKKTTSRSSMDVQQSSTPELSPESSTETSAQNKVDVTTTPPMSVKAGVNTPESSLGTSTTFIGPSTGADTTSRPTTSGQDRFTTESSSGTEVQFTGPGEASTGSDIPGKGDQAASEPTPTVQASTPKSSSVTSSGVTGPDNGANATTKPTLKSETSRPDMPDTKQIATPESFPGPPVQFTGPADEKKTTSRSSMDVQQSSTPGLPRESSTETSGPSKVGMTTKLAMSNKAGVSTPESSSGTSTTSIGPSTGDDTTLRPTTSGQNHSTTESSSETEEPPVQFTGPSEASTGFDIPGKGAEEASESTPTVQASTPKSSSVMSTGVTGPDSGPNATTKPTRPSSIPTSPEESTGITVSRETVDIATSSAPLASSISALEATKPDGAVHVTAQPTRHPTQKPFTAVTPSGSSSSTTAGPAEVSRPTGDPLVVIDGEMNPDHFHLTTEPAKATSKPTTPVSPSDRSEESRTTLKPSTQEIHKSPAPGKPAGPDDESGLTTPFSLGSTPVSGDAIRVTLQPDTPDRQPSTSGTLEPASGVTGSGRTSESTPVPDSGDIRKPSTSGMPVSGNQNLPSGPKEGVTFTPRPDIPISKKPSSLALVNVTLRPDIPDRQPPTSEPTRRATGPGGTSEITPAPDTQDTQKKFIRPDCVADPSVCHEKASCDHHTRQCSCNIGHIGDGFVCNPDPQDCVLRKDLCSPEALCIGRRCRCVEGFTGDGVKCVSLYQRSVNCSECDANAHCDGGMCKCNVGYFGNGLCCVPDPRDCVHFSGVCNPDATCDRDERVCKCNSGFLGDGISCFPVRSCRSDPNVCDVEAICLPSGQCLCKQGFRGNGYDCVKISPLLRHQPNEPLNSCGNSCDRETELCISGNCICKHGYEKHHDGRCVDVNECESSPCHHLATCTNLPGSFTCSCPDGYAGDGKTCIQHLKIGELGVFCEPDGMTLVLGNETTAFEGRIFVRGQAENPYCAKTFSPLQHASKPYMFKVPFEHCNVRLEDHDTFATTVIVQKHPMFITTAADAYDLRCTYPVGVREVESNVNVSDLTTSSTLTDNAHGPSCRLTVTNEADESIAAAVVGQALRLRLEVTPNETYSILPRNCFAINIESGERYSLTDKAGCAIDDQLFPEWTKIRPSLTEAVFRTFKWPDSSMIRFQCDCSACVGVCPEMNCGRRREAAMRRFRFRRVRDIKNGTSIEERPTDDDYDEDEEEKELLKKLIDPKRLAFSSLVRVREDEEEERAQQQVDHWRSGLASEPEVIKEVAAQEAAVCVRTILVIGAMAVTGFCVAILIFLSIRRRRCKETTSMQESVSTIGL
ncbi:hypothetical protein GCK32_010725, partial [Trichostrongylus colubriformis]